MEFRVLLNGEDVTEYTPLPMNDQKTLDETLNQGHIVLTYTDIEEAIKPFSSLIVEIKSGENNKKLSYFVASDNKTEIITNKTYTHDLSLIEQTKWLERFIISNRSLRNSLARSYPIATSEKALLTATYFRLWGGISEEYTDNTSNNIPSVVQKDDVIVFPSGASIRVNGYPLYTGVDYSLTVNLNGVEIAKTTNANAVLSVTAKESGIIEFVYKGWYTIVRCDSTQVTGSIQVETTEYQELQKETYTVTDAVNKLLEVAETIRESESPRFKFNREQAEEYSKVEIQETNFNGNLWECLKQVGDVIHSIPRLEDRVIYFDVLGSEEKCEAELDEYISSTETFNIENYASSIDSVVQNISNTDNEYVGAVVYPFDNGYITPRTYDTTAILTEENIFIPTPEPVSRILKLEVGYANGNDYKNTTIGEISQFVYEKTEYDMLSSYSSQYPNSKKYALYYTEGSPNIYGLNFKAPNPISEALEQYSINAILEKVTGKSISQITNNDTIMNLMFRITYTPLTNARLSQYRVNKNDNTMANALSFNQTANKVNSLAYGEVMKGTIAKLGNPEITKVFVFNDLDKLDKIKVGTKYDEEYYISVVKTEYYKDFIKVSVGLSKDFNAISEYVGIKNEIRHYEVAEKNTHESYIPYEDFCIIGDNENIAENETLLTNTGLQIISENLGGGVFETGKRTPSIAKVSTYLDGKIKDLVLPVTKLAIGNSVAYIVKFADNYSAGQSVTTGTVRHIQDYAKYASSLGNVKSIEIDIGAIDEAGVWTEEGGTSYDFYKQFGNDLPNANRINEMKGTWQSAINTNGDKIIIDKGSAETPIITYQLHFVSNRKSLIIGNAFAKLCGLVKETTKGLCDLYIFDKKLNQYTDVIDTDEGVLVGNVGFDIINDTTMEASAGVSGEFVGNHKAWAIVKDGQMLIGENVDFGNVFEINLPFLNFTRSLEKKTIQQEDYYKNEVIDVSSAETIVDLKGMKPCRDIVIDGEETRINTKKWKATLYYEDATHNRYEYTTELIDGVDNINVLGTSVELSGNGIMFVINADNTISATTETAQTIKDVLYVDCDENNKLKIKCNFHQGSWWYSMKFTGIKFEEITQTEYKI